MWKETLVMAGLLLMASLAGCSGGDTAKIGKLPDGTDPADAPAPLPRPLESVPEFVLEQMEIAVDTEAECLLTGQPYSGQGLSRLQAAGTDLQTIANVQQAQKAGWRLEMANKAPVWNTAYGGWQAIKDSCRICLLSTEINPDKVQKTPDLCLVNGVAILEADALATGPKDLNLSDSLETAIEKLGIPTSLSVSPSYGITAVWTHPSTMESLTILLQDAKGPLSSMQVRFPAALS